MDLRSGRSGQGRGNLGFTTGSLGGIGEGIKLLGTVLVLESDGLREYPFRDSRAGIPAYGRWAFDSPEVLYETP